MFNYYPILLIVQAFCIYHAYKNRVEQKWYYIIFFIPLIGCAIYLYHHFYSKDRLKNASEAAKGVFNSNYEIQKLEKELEFSDSLLNKKKLAHKYVEVGRYEEAIKIYKSCLSGFNAGDVETKMRLLRAYYLDEQFELAVETGNAIQDTHEFKQSDERIAYAWSLYEMGQSDSALKILKSFNQKNTNYKQRLEYARLLLQLGEKEQCAALVEELLNEFKFMERHERRHFQKIKAGIQELSNSL